MRVCTRLPALVALASWLGLAGCSTTPEADSPSGQSAWIELLRGSGREVVWITGALDALEQPVTTLVVLPRTRLTVSDYLALEAFAEEGGTVHLVADDPTARRYGLERLPGDRTVTGLRAVTPLPGDPTDTAEPPAPLMVARPRALAVEGSGDGGEPVVLRDDGLAHVLRLRRGAGELIVYADPWLLSNVALAFGEDAELIRRLVVGDLVGLVDNWTWAPDETPYDKPLEPWWLPATLHGVALALLVIAAAGVRTGRPRDPAPASGRRFVEHAEAAGLFWARGGATRHAERAYAAWALDRLRQQFDPGRRAATTAELAEAIARRTGASIASAHATLGAAERAARNEPPGHPDAELPFEIWSASVAAWLQRAEPARNLDHPPAPRTPT
jgi:hypothetical protein